MPEMLNEQQRVLRDRVETFVEHELRPLESRLPVEPLARIPLELRQTVVERANLAGIYRLFQPAEHGGGGAGVLERVIVTEALARSNLRLSRHALGPEPGMLANAQGWLRERYLLPLLAGEKRSALAITEPRDGSSPTIARRSEGLLRISGTKSYVTGGAEADFYIVLVQFEPSEQNAGSRALVVIDRNAQGLTIEREFHSTDGSHHVQLAFEDTAVNERQLLGESNVGTSRTQVGLTGVRLQVAARATGAALWAIEYTVKRLAAKDRSGSILGSNEAVRLRLADMWIAAYAARSALYRTARLAENGEPIRNEVTLVKVLCTEMAAQVVDRAAQLEGGQALVQGHLLERLRRELQALQVAEGASDVLRQSLAKGVLEHGFSRL